MLCLCYCLFMQLFSKRLSYETWCSDIFCIIYCDSSAATFDDETRTAQLWIMGLDCIACTDSPPCISLSLPLFRPLVSFKKHCTIQTKSVRMSKSLHWYITLNLGQPAWAGIDMKRGLHDARLNPILRTYREACKEAKGRNVSFTITS